MTCSGCSTYSAPASSIVLRCGPASTTSVAISRRSSASACVRIRPCAVEARRFTPICRLMRRPPTRQERYHVSRPLLSDRTKSRPDPYERRAITTTMSPDDANHPRPNWNHGLD
jgi:hypothetical protein